MICNLFLLSYMLHACCVHIQTSILRRITCHNLIIRSHWLHLIAVSTALHRQVLPFTIYQSARGPHMCLASKLLLFILEAVGKTLKLRFELNVHTNILFDQGFLTCIKERHSCCLGSIWLHLLNLIHRLHLIQRFAYMNRLNHKQKIILISVCESCIYFNTNHTHL